MKINISHIFLLVMMFGFLACKRDKISSYNVTPYNLEIPDHFPQMDIPEDNPMTVEGVELGRRLFYDKILSRDNTVSCASCHKQEEGFSDSRQFSEGVGGNVGRRQSMALVNLGWQKFFFWDGRAATLEEQVFHPVTDPTEMDLSWEEAVIRLKNDTYYSNQFYKAFNEEDFDSTHVSKAIAQFMRTLISANSKYDVMYKVKNDIQLTQKDKDVLNTISPEEWAGHDLFFAMSGGDCLHCHDGALGQVQIFSNNGMDLVFEDEGRYEITGNPNHLGLFKVPTLRNIEVTGPYMHDGRFETLDEVVEHYSIHVMKESPNIDPMMEFAHQGGVALEDEAYLVVKFLKCFTDEEFLTNPDFSNPFE